MPVVGIFQQIGFPEMIIILFLALLIFGAKRLPEMGRSMGKSLREFKGAMQGMADQSKSGEDEDEDEDETPPAQSANGEVASTKDGKLSKGRASDE